MLPNYVIITPARNEEACVGRLLDSMKVQTVKPLRWVIVSDGSTDRTDELVRKAALGNSWIELLRMPEHRDRHFAAKAMCFNAGYEKIRTLDFEIIGNLDADLSFEKDYFELLLGKFEKNFSLGVAGTPFVDEGTNESYNYQYTNIEHVSGACQMFRKRCFEEIGGYQPIEGGGIDWVAVTTARMKGWKTRTFTDRKLVHHRKMGSANVHPLKSAFNLGKKDYCLGNHPVWEVFRCVYQMVGTRPKFVGGMVLLCGYIAAFAGRQKRPISGDLVSFARREQLRRLYAKIGFGRGQ